MQDISRKVTQRNETNRVMCAAAAGLPAVPRGPEPVCGPSAGQPVCGGVPLHLQPAGLPQPAGEPAQQHQRAQHRHLELRVSVHATITVIQLQHTILFSASRSGRVDQMIH